MSLKNIYLRLCCIFLAAQSFFSCETWAFHCDGCSYCRVQAPGQSHLSSFGTQTQSLQLTGSRARARWLWCPAACGVFSDQGLNPCPLHWQVDSSHQTTRELQHTQFSDSCSITKTLNVIALQSWIVKIVCVRLLSHSVVSNSL